MSRLHSLFQSVAAPTTLATIAICMTVVALARPAEAATGDPWVKTGFKNGPVSLSFSYKEVGRLSLPAGDYTVFAKVQLTTGGGGYGTCRLTVGPIAADESRWSIGASTASQTVDLNVSEKLTVKGSAVVTCYAAGAAPQADWIKITAMRARTLTIVQMT
jgi:hypothetical protein